MIFDNNSTALGTMSLPVMEGYDADTGAARALIESARNDYAMFKAMLSVDSRECQIQQESSNYVVEGEITSLAEAAGAGIWQKIKDLFIKLGQKIKSIFTNFIARITGLFAKDKTLVKKYKSTILGKSNLGKMEVKFAKVKKDPLGDIPNEAAQSLDTISGYYDDSTETMIKNCFAGISAVNDAENNSEFAEKYHEQFFEDEDTDELSKFGLSGASLVKYMEDYSSKIKTLNRAITNLERNIKARVKEAEDQQKLAMDGMSKDKPGTDAEKEATLNKGTKTYQASLKYQECSIWMNKCLLNEAAFDYKQHKAAFMKAVTINDKKLNESAVYADAIAEASAQEVEDVLTGAISKEELSNFNAASKSILGDGISDDPYANEYDKCSYYSTSPDYKVDGSIDSCINSRCGCKNESASFGELFY